MAEEPTVYIVWRRPQGRWQSAWERLPGEQGVLPVCTTRTEALQRVQQEQMRNYEVEYDYSIQPAGERPPTAFTYHHRMLTPRRYG